MVTFVSRSFSSRSSDADVELEPPLHHVQQPLQDDAQPHQRWLLSKSQRKWYTGMMVSTLFAAAYYVRPIHMAIPILMAYYGVPTLFFSYMVLSVLLVSVLIPPIPSRALVASLFGPLLQYFEYDQIVENSPVSIRESMKDGQQYIFGCQPHGVVPFCGVAWSVFQAQTTQDDQTPYVIPTAVASRCLNTPILKHVLGLLSCVSASRASLQQTLTTHSVRVYVGGTTEIFECNEYVEVLHLTKHKGFIKLALQLGVDVVPVYMFGNTSVYAVSNDKYGILVRLSRLLQLPVTYCKGAYGLPIPHNDKLLHVSGQPLGMPRVPIKRPRQAVIDHWHQIYCQQVQRLFDHYKERVPRYKKKKLVIV